MVTGAVTISPPGVLFQVCDGDQLELICTINGSENSLLEWTLKFAPATIFMGQLKRAIEDREGDQTSSIMINSTKFTFSRISAKQEFLVSRLLISPATTGLNETVVNCTDVIAMETASAIVYVLNRLTDSTSC